MDSSMVQDAGIQTSEPANAEMAAGARRGVESEQGVCRTRSASRRRMSLIHFLSLSVSLP